MTVEEKIREMLEGPWAIEFSQYFRSGGYLPV